MPLTSPASSIVSKIKKDKIVSQFQQMQSEDYECPVCCEEFEPELHRGYRAKCSHAFCEPCLRRLGGEKWGCPVCRFVLKPCPLHRIAVAPASDESSDDFSQSLAIPRSPSPSQRLSASCRAPVSFEEAIRCPELDNSAPSSQAVRRLAPSIAPSLHNSYCGCTTGPQLQCGRRDPDWDGFPS